MDLLKEGQLVLVFSLGDAVAETAGAVARFHRELAQEGLAHESENAKKQNL